jgi:general secretion pathway protein K
MTPRSGQRGAALISAMITVTLVASLASAALWQQCRHVEIESAERSRAQTAWLLTGALDFSRLVLREDKGPADHLAEPWALGLQESKLSSFLAQDKQLREGDPEVYLSGGMTDAQSRLNVRNLIDNGQISLNGRAPFAKLFTLLGLPLSELNTLQQQLLRAQPANGRPSSSAEMPANAPLMPQHTAQLVWLGLSPRTVAQLAPYVAVLPESSPLNLNTAGPEVIYASLPSMDMATAQQFVRQRASRAPLETLESASKALGLHTDNSLDSKQFSINTKYFFIRGRMRLEDTVQEDDLLVERNGTKVRIVWRYRAVQNRPATPGSASLLQSAQP